MSSGITLSGFNNIDFNQILEALMAQERLPVTLLEAQKASAEKQKTAYATLASRLSSLQSAADTLKSSTAFNGSEAVVSDDTRLKFNAGAVTPEGSYEILISELAHAQTTTSTNTYADRDTTTVADGGTIVIGGVSVAIAGAVTLDGLATAINETDDIGVVASVVQNGSTYKLMLTGRDTGAANSFTVDASALTNGGGATAFAFTNNQAATDAAITVNNVAVTSETNTFDDVIAGSSFTVLRKDAATSVTVSLAHSNEPVKAAVQKFVTAYNDVVSYIGSQQTSSNNGNADAISRDPLVRGLRSSLAQTLTSVVGTGSTFQSLAEVGFTFARNGQLEFDSAAFETALTTNEDEVRGLFYGTDGTDGAFGKLSAVVDTYTTSGGLLPNAQERLADQVTKLADRIADMEERLAIRRLAMQREFTAADMAISQLNQSGSSLSSLYS